MPVSNYRAPIGALMVSSVAGHYCDFLWPNFRSVPFVSSR